VRAEEEDLRGALGLTADKQTKTPGSDTARARARTNAARGKDPHVADALRNAYQEAVREDIPQEFLDLLGKLA
jgi:hypothetical protein